MQGMGEQAVTNLWSRFVWQLFVKRGVAGATLATCSRVNWFNLSHLYNDVGRHPRPTLLLWGERDGLNPPATVGQKVAGYFSNAKLLVIPQAGHIALCDQPTEVHPRILRFLSLPENTSMASVGELGMRQSRLRAERPLESQPKTREGSAEMPVPMILGNTDVASTVQDEGRDTLTL